jgi:hypothetical protein
MTAHTCNPSYLGDWDGEGCGLRPAQANSSWDPISKISRVKWTEVWPSVKAPALHPWSPARPKKKKKSRSSE